MFEKEGFQAVKKDQKKAVIFILKSTTGWNDKIGALEKITWFHFHLMKTGFLFLL